MHSLMFWCWIAGLVCCQSFTPLNKLVYGKAFLSVLKTNLFNEVFDENLFMREILRPSVPSGFDICYFILVASSCIRWEQNVRRIGPLSNDPSILQNDFNMKWSQIQLYSVSYRNMRIFLWIFTLIFAKNVLPAC